jgi:L-lactate dehydrogenase complex protein LldG
MARLQRKAPPFPDAEPPARYRPVVPLPDLSAEALQALFIHEAQKAACVVHQPVSANEAVAAILALIGGDRLISSWDADQIPLPGLQEALAQAGVSCAGQDASVRLGLTGVDAALAATGSLVLSSGDGRYRASSLLPPVHVAVVASSQIVPDLEQWWGQQRANGLAQVRRASNIVIVTGPSRTADIAMELVMGMHGPREVHIVLLKG